MKVIDPSEILIDGEGTIKEEPTAANPWARFLARIFDYSLFFLALTALRYWIHRPLMIDRVESFIPIEYLLWIPFEALFLWAFKTTPGKWWFRITLRQGRNERLAFITALQRAFRVWIRGIGFGIPFINGLCMIVAYHRLKVFKITSWDREDHIQVTHYPLSQARIVIGALIGIVGLVIYWVI